MTNSAEPPLRGIPIYNPQLMSREELLRVFVARQEELTRIVDQLRREVAAQPQHHLIVGARGMGKTTLLARIRHAIADDALLARHCLPLVFPEEQYNVGSLADFWLNCIDALTDMLELMNRAEHVDGLDREVARVSAVPVEAERRRSALDLLCKLAEQLDRRLVLLVDNVDMVLDRLERDEWALREVLSAEPRIQLIGATSAPLESYYRHDRAFYDFFRVHHLTGLSDAETFRVLHGLAAATGNARVERLLNEEPGRIKTIRLMSGGNPRTVVLMFTLLELGADGDVRSDLERLLDLCTPLYKHRIEALPSQAQQIIDAIAMHWHPATAADLAETIHLKINAISSQLERLVKDGIVEKVTIPGSSRLGFQIAERFFNIWCLMRASRRVRRRLAWFVEFLRMMFGLDELKRLARRQFDGARARDPLRHAEMGLALADVLEESSMRHALEADSLRALCSDRAIRDRLAEFLDLDGRDVALVDRAERMRLLAEAREAVLAAGEHRPGWDAEGFWTRLSGVFSVSPYQKHQLAQQIGSASDSWISGLDAMIQLENSFWGGGLTPTELVQLQDAIRKGDIDLSALSREDLMAAAELYGSAIVPCALAVSWSGDPEMPVEVECLAQTVEDSGSLYPRVMWAEFASRSGVVREEIGARLCDVADEHDWSAEALSDLGRAFAIRAEDFVAAERMWRRALAKNPEGYNIHLGLGVALRKQGKYEAAGVAFRRAVDLDPVPADGWLQLGVTLGLQPGCYGAAEVALREAISRGHKSVQTWTFLGALLREQGRFEAAVAAFREAVAIDPKASEGWNGLAYSLYCGRMGLEEASQAASVAIRLNGSDVNHAHTLATILMARGEWGAAEPYARQFIEGDAEFHDAMWGEILRFFAEAILHGFHNEARAMLVSMGLAERWMPLVHALDVAARGPQLLGTFAPEMREAIRLVLERVAPTALEA
jgi:tetratricopeptide (TPR) repeat protein